jgi:hypothetical protein
MRKPITALCLLMFAAIVVPAKSGFADVILPTLAQVPAGSQYQIILMTSTATFATNTSISYYNTIASNAANSNATLAALGATWTAVASTEAVAATANAPWANDSVFNTQGIQVASPAQGLYSGNLLSAVAYDQNGTLYTSDGSAGVWTGSADPPAGAIRPAYALGDSSADYGSAGAYGTAWLFSNYGLTYGGSFAILNFYALSSPITQTPEPATSLLAVAACAVGLGSRHRRRR